jgi:RimJ/RimL family protein N-acetyltransferase
VTNDDLLVFFEQQNDPDAIKMAAFPPRDYNAFMEHWTNILNDDNVLKRTIIYYDQIAGNIVSFTRSEKREVGYWLGKNYWGHGIATQALSKFIKEENYRPLYAHVAKHNLASIRVLKKCGFILVGLDEDFFNENGDRIEGLIMELNK